MNCSRKWRDVKHPMTKEQYRALRERLGLTQAELAEKLGIRMNSVWRRESGLSPILREAELALRWLAHKLRE